jgi:hypothetical protein
VSKAARSAALKYTISRAQRSWPNSPRVRLHSAWYRSGVVLTLHAAIAEP